MNKQAPRLSRQARATLRNMTPAQREKLTPWAQLIKPGIAGYRDRIAVLHAAESL